MINWGLVVMLLRRMLRADYISGYVDVDRKCLYRWQEGVIPKPINRLKMLQLACKHLSESEISRCGITDESIKQQRAEALDEMAKIDSELGLL